MDLSSRGIDQRMLPVKRFERTPPFLRGPLASTFLGFQAPPLFVQNEERERAWKSN